MPEAKLEATRAKLRERLVQIFRRNRDEQTTELDIENLERDLELDALRAEVLDLQRLLIQYQRWHIQSLTQQEEE